ncbi:MAG TPA: hypothetical protein PKZ40_05670 [Anaerolineaceae bacterium]|nr:hypothetical protein [Anaerolineaceae bacterium]
MATPQITTANRISLILCFGFSLISLIVVFIDAEFSMPKAKTLATPIFFAVLGIVLTLRSKNNNFTDRST